VFTARYGLIPYIKQITLRLQKVKHDLVLPVFWTLSVALVFSSDKDQSTGLQQSVYIEAEPCRVDMNAKLSICL
jgi:hypothetical protein